MTRPPIRRSPNRQVAAPVPFPLPTGAAADAVAQEAGPPGDGEAARDAEGAPIASREQLAQLLGQIREQGDIGVGDEVAVLREYDAMLVQLRSEKLQMHDEYRERLARDGHDATEAWLAEAAAHLGRRQGEQMRRLLETVPTLIEGMTNASPSGS